MICGIFNFTKYLKGNQTNEKTRFYRTRVTSDSNFAYPIRVTMSANRQSQQRIGVAPELLKDFDVVLYKDGKEVGKKEVRGNYLRLAVCDVEPTEADEVKIHVLATNGAPTIKVYEVRIY